MDGWVAALGGGVGMPCAHSSETSYAAASPAVHKTLLLSPFSLQCPSQACLEKPIVAHSKSTEERTKEEEGGRERVFFTHRAAAARPVATAPPRAPTSRSAQIPSAAAASRAAATPPHHEQHRHHPAAAAHVVPPLPPLLPLYRPHYYYHHPRQPASPLRSVWRPSLLTARIGARPPLALSGPCSVRKRLFALGFPMFVPSLSWQAFSF
jgi:hypothetical protein